MTNRNHEVRVKLSEEEYKKVKKKSTEVSMSLSGLLRYLALNSTLRVVIEEH